MEIKAHPAFKVGDTMSVEVPVFRRWWQFWKPRVLRYERQQFRFTEVVTGDGWRVAKPPKSPNRPAS